MRGDVIQKMKIQIFEKGNGNAISILQSLQISLLPFKHGEEKFDFRIYVKYL